MKNYWLRKLLISECDKVIRVNVDRRTQQAIYIHIGTGIIMAIRPVDHTPADAEMRAWVKRAKELDKEHKKKVWILI